MSVSKELKTKVYNDWLRVFPELVAYNKNQLLKIAGPILFGIEIDKSSWGDVYRLYFIIYSLWEKNILECTKGPLLFLEIHNKKNLQFKIPFNKHEQYFEDAVNCVRNYIKIPFEGNISLKSIYQVINTYTTNNSSYDITCTYLLKIYILFYLECYKEMDKLLLEIKANKKKLESLHFKHFFGSFDEWFINLEKSLSDRDKFIWTIEANKQDKKIKNLLVSDILNLKSGFWCKDYHL